MKFAYAIRPQNLNFRQLDVADLDSGVQVRKPNLKVSDKDINFLIKQVRDQFFSPSGAAAAVPYLMSAKGFKPAKFKPEIF
jgi:hypothetical protein